VFGYYIEVTAAHQAKIDDRAEAFATWSRKQTLKNAERYVTPPLKEYESKVLSAQSRAIAREQELFADLCAQAQAKLPALQTFADVAAQLDVLACFARRAARYRYVQPAMVDEPVLHIRAGRHPVLDELLGDRFVPNDVALGAIVQGPESRVQSQEPETRNLKPETLALITGPNMAGKSTYIRQAALITLLAHTGSFVPAEQAMVGLCDRIFTRIGASDELHAGQSTFMVEMTEAANICHHATRRSLVILDEIGRGTSTLDGLSLAWAITEHLAVRGCRTLFATHYHELTALAEHNGAIANLNVTVREWQGQVVFLHRIAPGAADRSYGIHVAKIAGMPGPVVARADELLAQLEVNHHGAGAAGAVGGVASRGWQPAASGGGAPGSGEQLPLFTQYLEHPVLEELRRVNLEDLSPMAAFDLLRRLHDRADGT
jgi:DNA mismatch repair protein MutS